MEFGVSLPLIAWEGDSCSLRRLRSFTDTARRLSYSAVSANDHLVFARPWLDGPTALAAVLDQTGDMDLATTVSIPVVRGPVQMAKTLGALDFLSGGRIVVGVGPGSSPRDYAAVGVPFEERWKRVDEAVQAMRSLWTPGAEPFVGSFYSTEGIELQPEPAREGGPPIWIGSWGSEAGIRRTARLADGWLASAYNATPELFAEGWSRLRAQLPAHGKDPATFPNAIATMVFHITDDRAEAERIVTEVVSPTLNRPADQLRERLLIGPADECAAKLAAYAAVGAQRVYLWPVRDEERQIELFQQRVAPAVEPPK